MIEDVEILAADLTLEKEVQPALWIFADADLFQQVLQNLAINADNIHHPSAGDDWHLKPDGQFWQEKDR